jgi:hypothetical protein
VEGRLGRDFASRSCFAAENVQNAVGILHNISAAPAELAERRGRPMTCGPSKNISETTPGASISYEFIAERLKDVFEDYQVTKIAFDRWNYPHLRPWLGKVGFSEQLLERTFVELGQGFKSMSPALRAREPGLGKEAPARQPSDLNPVRGQCGRRAHAAGNRKLSKKRARGRIDGMVALAMAIGVAPAAWTAKVDVALWSIERRVDLCLRTRVKAAGLGRRMGKTVVAGARNRLGLLLSNKCARNANRFDCLSNGRRFESCSGTLASVAASLEGVSGLSVCVLVDQFEELFRFEMEEGRDEAELFIDLINRAATEDQGESPAVDST